LLLDRRTKRDASPRGDSPPRERFPCAPITPLPLVAALGACASSRNSGTDLPAAFRTSVDDAGSRVELVARETSGVIGSFGALPTLLALGAGLLAVLVVVLAIRKVCGGAWRVLALLVGAGLLAAIFLTEASPIA